MSSGFETKCAVFIDGSDEKLYVARVHANPDDVMSLKMYENGFVQLYKTMATDPSGLTEYFNPMWVNRDRLLFLD